MNRADDLSSTQTQLLKGVLDLAILTVLERRPTYGYEVARQLREAGLEGVAEASVYGTLRRLFSAGALSSRVEPSAEGPDRKVYELTARGHDQLETKSKAWSAFADALETLIHPTPRSSGGRP